MYETLYWTCPHRPVHQRPKTSTAFYEALGGVVTDHADVEKPTGTNHITMVRMPGFFWRSSSPTTAAL
ncbi:MAG: hypothetical protein ACLUD2_20625 [Clostridium sp.]